MGKYFPLAAVPFLKLLNPINFIYSFISRSLHKLPRHWISSHAITSCHKRGVLKQTEVYSFTVSEAGSLKWRCQPRGRALSWLPGLPIILHMPCLCSAPIITWWSPLRLCCPLFLHKETSHIGLRAHPTPVWDYVHWRPYFPSKIIYRYGVGASTDLFEAYNFTHNKHRRQYIVSTSIFTRWSFNSVPYPCTHDDETKLSKPANSFRHLQ